MGLYAGDDLHRAADLSSPASNGQSRFHGFRNAAGIALDLGAARLRNRAHPPLELLVAVGQDPESGREISVTYAGYGANRAWCLSNAFRNYRVVERTPPVSGSDLGHTLDRLVHETDISFLDGLSPRFVASGGRSFVTMPAWIKQRVLLSGDWPAQVDGLRRATRQEVRRFLRKYRYECHLSRQALHFADFYEHLYVPYVSRRFEAAAMIVDRERFLRECRRGILLRLTREGNLHGAALLRRVGNTMAVVWSAVDSGSDAASSRGATDAMDYFSLLYAHVTGCRWLDLGPSRPDLCDGILRYKAKWGATITAGLVPQPTIAWTCNAPHGGNLYLLRRHAFLRRTRTGLQAVIVLGGQDDADELGGKVTAGLQSGIRDFKVVNAPGMSVALPDSLQGVDARLSFLDASGYPDFMSALSVAAAEG